MTQALYRKWRPRQWDEVVGQEHVIQTLKNSVRLERVGHAYLFAGPRGTGKTTTARLLAKAVNCLAADLVERPCDQCQHCKAISEGRFLDIIEIDAASNTSVDDVRDLREKINFAPSQGRFKVYIIDEVHMLSTAAFNALLKTLEEPPPHAIFVLATTEVHKIPATVLSRCQRHEFRRVPVKTIVELLERLVKEEGLKVESKALTLIARQSTGSLRDAISLLDQLASAGEKVTLRLAQTMLGTATSQTVVELVEAVLAGQTAAGFECLHQALDGGADPRQFARQVVDYLRGLLLVKLGSAGQVDAPGEVLEQMAVHAQAFTLARLLETIRWFNQAATDTRSGWQPGLSLELALAAAAADEPGADVPEPAAPSMARKVKSRSLQEDPAVAEKTPAPPPAENRQAADAGKRSTPQEDPASEGAAPPVGEPAAAQESGGKQLGLSEIQKQWRAIRLLVKEQSKPTEALLNSCKLLMVKEGVLYLGFATEVLKSKMEMNENRELTARAISQALGGGEVGVACVVVSAKSRDADLDLDVDGDGMVRTALNLGGKIVHKD